MRTIIPVIMHYFSNSLFLCVYSRALQIYSLGTTNLKKNLVRFQKFIECCNTTVYPASIIKEETRWPVYFAHDIANQAPVFDV